MAETGLWGPCALPTHVRSTAASTVDKTGFATVSECEECEESEGKPVPESIFRKIREAHEHA